MCHENIYALAVIGGGIAVRAVDSIDQRRRKRMGEAALKDMD